MKMILLVTSIICIIDGVIAQAEDAQAWRLYVDHDYNFSLEYPAAWSAKTLVENVGKGETIIKKKIAFTSPAETAIIIDIWRNELGQDVMTWFRRTQMGLISEECVIPEAANAAVEGESALTLFNPQRQSSDQQLTYFRSGNLMFRLEYRVTDADLSLPIYKRMLSSFTRTAQQKESKNE